MIFGQGLLPLALDKTISNCRAAVLVLVHPECFISPLRTIPGESSPNRHLERRPMGEEIKKCTECTYLGTKIDQFGDNTTKIKHRIIQTGKAINVLNSIWWHKNITKNKKLYIYKTTIQSILVYGAEV